MVYSNSQYDLVESSLHYGGFTGTGIWPLFDIHLVGHAPQTCEETTWHMEGIRQYDSSDTGHSDNVNIAAEHQEPAEVLSQLDNTSNSPVYGEYKCC